MNGNGYNLMYYKKKDLWLCTDCAKRSLNNMFIATSENWKITRATFTGGYINGNSREAEKEWFG